MADISWMTFSNAFAMAETFHNEIHNQLKFVMPITKHITGSGKGSALHQQQTIISEHVTTQLPDT